MWRDVIASPLGINSLLVRDGFVWSKQVVVPLGGVTTRDRSGEL